VETRRGHYLGRIVGRGFTESDTGEPGDIGGYTHHRLLRAPVDGTFESRQVIGSRVEAGDIIGSVAGVEVQTRIPGVLRGLLWPGLSVTSGQKVGDVDPRGDASLCHTLSDKARTVSGSVLEIVVAHAGREPKSDS